MFVDGKYWSVFVTEPGRTPEQIAAWCRAYADFVSEVAPERYGWAQKKADDEWQKYLGE